MRQFFLKTDTVRDEQGRSFPLGERLGEGGQGEVFSVEGEPELVIKRFFPRVLADDQDQKLRRKVTALQEKQLERLVPTAAWPRFSVYSQAREWCGYAMRRVEGLALHPAGLLNPRRLQQRYPAIQRPQLAALALQFLRTVLLLEKEGVQIGDYNHNNFRYDPVRQELGFIDTDAFQVRHQGSIYVCPVTAAELTPPEFLNEVVKWNWRNPENEIFSVAIITFLILMPGKHPFESRQADECSENLLRPDGFPYRPASGRSGPPTGRVPQGIWETVWYDFPPALQQRFTAIFLNGHAHPKKRGTVAMLVRAVEEYADGLRQGKHQLMPLLGKPVAVSPTDRSLPMPTLARPAGPAGCADTPRPPPAPLSPGAPIGLFRAHAKAMGEALVRVLNW